MTSYEVRQIIKYYLERQGQKVEENMPGKLDARLLKPLSLKGDANILNWF